MRHLVSTHRVGGEQGSCLGRVAQGPLGKLDSWLRERGAGWRRGGRAEPVGRPQSAPGTKEGRGQCCTSAPPGPTDTQAPDVPTVAKPHPHPQPQTWSKQTRRHLPVHFNQNSIIRRVLIAYNVGMGMSAWSYKWNFHNSHLKHV